MIAVLFYNVIQKFYRQSKSSKKNFNFFKIVQFNKKIVTMPT